MRVRWRGERKEVRTAKSEETTEKEYRMFHSCEFWALSMGIQVS